MVYNDSFKEFIQAWPTGGRSSKWGSLWITSPSLMVWHVCKERNRRIFREKEMEVNILINKIQGAIEETINGKICGSKYKYYSKWDREMEQVLKLKQSSSHIQGIKNIERKRVKWDPPLVVGKRWTSMGLAEEIHVYQAMEWLLEMKKANL